MATASSMSNLVLISNSQAAGGKNSASGVRRPRPGDRLLCGSSRPRLSGSLTSCDNDSEFIKFRHKKHMIKVRDLLYKANSPSESMLMIDFLQKLGIDYHFSEEIREKLGSLYDQYIHSMIGSNKINLHEAALLFRLLRQARFPVSSDVFQRFLDGKGDFKLSLQEDIKGMLNLYEASYLNTGEAILYKANEFCINHLESAIPHLEPNLAWQVQEALDHPYHKTIQRYQARRYLDRRGKENSRSTNVEELARMDLILVQSLHQMELAEVTKWWGNMGLKQELTSVVAIPLKWYIWPMTTLSDPKFCLYRIVLTKVVAFVHLLDDIFDVHGSLDELILFADAITKWDLSAIDCLPNYMRNVYTALYKTTHEIAELVLEEHGWNPINSLKKSWTDLCNAFLVEAKWFNYKLVPAADNYLENGIISSGVHTVLTHFYFLLGDRTREEAVDLIESNPKMTFSLAKILRLCDDLSAKEEEVEGFDGSFLECFMKENPRYSTESATVHTKFMITKAWEELNKECFSSNSPFSETFATTCLNTARMVSVMYYYGGEQKPMDDHVNSLLFKSS